MGWDISYHPVDVVLIRERILPYVQGDGSIDDLVDRALTTARVRFAANAWGLAVMELNHRLTDAQLDELPPPTPPKGLLSKLFGGSEPEEQEELPPIHGINVFDSDVHVWGRPFFIHAKTPREVSEAINNYMSASPEMVDGIVANMIQGLANECRQDIENFAVISKYLGTDAFEKLTPKADEKLPPEADIRHGIRWKIDLFRDAYAAIKEGRNARDADGNEHDPESLFETDFCLAVVEFAANFRPGWMARGYGWPRFLLAQVGIDPSTFFETPKALFAPLLDEVPQIGKHFSNTIRENFMVGGYVPADKVPELLILVTANEKAINDWARSEGWGDEGAAIYLQGIKEALTDAASRKLAFAEATEVYSGPMGIMN